MEVKYRDFLCLRDLKKKIIRYKHHKEVYKRSLVEKVIPQGLRYDRTDFGGSLSISVIKDINDFLRKLRGLSFVPDTVLICTMDDVDCIPTFLIVKDWKHLERPRRKEILRFLWRIFII